MAVLVGRQAKGDGVVCGEAGAVEAEADAAVVEGVVEALGLCHCGPVGRGGWGADDVFVGVVVVAVIAVIVRGVDGGGKGVEGEDGVFARVPDQETACCYGGGLNEVVLKDKAVSCWDPL